MGRSGAVVNDQGLRSRQTVGEKRTLSEGKGVSSSAAVETAVMQAAACAFDLTIAPRDLTPLCQQAENLVGGAPCVVMDQMTCVFGVPEALMAL